MSDDFQGFNESTSFFLIEGILQASNETKQKLGQKFALYLNLIPGPDGPDDGVDGYGYFEGKRIHFQSKLKSEALDINEARMYYSDIKYNQANISVMISGRGYKETFKQRLFGHPDIDKVVIHLLTLQDVFEKSERFWRAVADLPSLRGLNRIVQENMI